MLEQRPNHLFSSSDLIQELGLPEARIASLFGNAVKRIDDYSIKEPFSEYPMLGGQRKAFKGIRNAFADGENAMYGVWGVAPPGYGKNALYAKLADALQLKTLIVAPTTVIVDQIGESIDKFAENLTYGKVYDRKRQYGRQVVITTYDSFLEKVENGEFNPLNYELLILDEAHEALSLRQQQAVRKFNATSIIVGGTATEKYSEEKRIQNLLRKKAFYVNIQEAIEEGRLSSAQGYVAMVDVDYSGASISGAENCRERDLQKKLEINALNKAAIDIYLNFKRDGLPISGQRALAYCDTIRDAEELAKLFKEKGVAAEAISGRDSVAQKQDKLKRFDSGDIKILTNVDILVPGFDQPKATVCLNLRRTFSLVVAGQRLRVLRTDFDNPDKVGLIFDIFLREQLEKSRNIPFIAAAIINGINISRDINHRYIISSAGSTIGDSENQETLIFNKTEENGEVVISGVRITQDLERVFELMSSKEKFRHMFSEDELMLLNKLAKELNVDQEIILSILRNIGLKYPDKYPELTKKISPIPEDRLRELVMEYRTFPIAGAKCANDVVREMRREGYEVGQAMVKGSFLRIGKENPGERGIHQHPKANKSVRYLSAVGVDLVRKDIVNKLKIPTPPKDWLTISRLRIRLQKRYSVDYKFVKDAVAALKKEDPEGFGIFRSSNYVTAGVMGVHEHISPEKALRVEEKARMRFESKPPFAEQGWMSYGDYKRSRGIHDTKAKKIAEQFRTDHPEWFAINSRMRGKPSEHMHPDLIKELDIVFKTNMSFAEHEEHLVFSR